MTRPPSGNAGGDLAGNYPNPLIAGNAVGPGEIQNRPRSVNLPLGSFLNQTDQAAIDFTPSNGTSPDFDITTGSTLAIEWDDDQDGGGGDLADTDFVTSTFTVPPDYASGGSLALSVSKDGHTGVDERLRCGISINDVVDSALNFRTTDDDALKSYAIPVSKPYTAGVSAAVVCNVDNGSFGTSANDIVRVHSIEFRYTATQ